MALSIGSKMKMSSTVLGELVEVLTGNWLKFLFKKDWPLAKAIVSVTSSTGESEVIFRMTKLDGEAADVVDLVVVVTRLEWWFEERIVSLADNGFESCLTCLKLFAVGRWEVGVDDLDCFSSVTRIKSFVLWDRQVPLSVLLRPASVPSDVA